MIIFLFVIKNIGYNYISIILRYFIFVYHIFMQYRKFTSIVMLLILVFNNSLIPMNYVISDDISAIVAWSDYVLDSEWLIDEDLVIDDKNVVGENLNTNVVGISWDIDEYFDDLDGEQDNVQVDWDDLLIALENDELGDYLINRKVDVITLESDKLKDINLDKTLDEKKLSIDDKKDLLWGNILKSWWQDILLLGEISSTFQVLFYDWGENIWTWNVVSWEVISDEILSELSWYINSKIWYVFSGWCTDLELTQDFDLNTPIVQNLDLYAKWKCDIENHYELNGGICACEDWFSEENEWIARTKYSNEW